LGSGLKEFPPGAVFSQLVEVKALPRWSEAVVLWGAVAASVATFAFPASISAAPEDLTFDTVSTG
jgi:hypothetical protein